MARRARLIWTAKAEKNLEEIFRLISHSDSPRAARSFTSRITSEAKKLKDFPELGSPVEGLADPTIREIFVGSYRVLCKFRRPTIEILAVRHGAMLLGEEDLPSE
jgi:toxin ParE1/3/4